MLCDNSEIGNNINVTVKPTDFQCVMLLCDIVTLKIETLL